MIRTLILLAAVAAACAQEPTKDSHEITIDNITAAVCQVETGTTYVGRGQVSGRWGMGAAGETGPWQVSPMVLRDMESGSGRGRSVAWHERTFRKWYAHLVEEVGSHEQALAAYHRGLGGRARKDAKDYAARVMNLAEDYAK